LLDIPVAWITKLCYGWQPYTPLVLLMQVIMVVRNVESAKEALKRMRDESRVKHGHVDILYCDLSSLRYSACQAATKSRAKGVVLACCLCTFTHATS
jgi:hypothetical protein